MSKDKTFTIGEFANLFGISKQTLFYYERNNIFVPKIIADNGYRYYTMDQYYIFEIIITLRKLGIPLKTIKNYVEHRNSLDLQKLLDDKILECVLFSSFKVAYKVVVFPDPVGPEINTIPLGFLILSK